MRQRVVGFVFLGLIAVSAGYPATAKEQPAAARPNIVVIMVDDMGYSDPGCYGGEIQTPNIDSLASNGVRFSQFYNCSRCCQTRASLLTGAYPQRVGASEFGKTMDVEVPTLAQRLKRAGYLTGLMGKWHLSELPPETDAAERVKWLNHQVDLPTPFAAANSLPTRRGFDRFYGIVWGVVNHFDPFSLCEGEEPVRDVPDDFYLPDAISDKSVEFVQEATSKDQPFFLYVAYDSPHWPIQAKSEDIDKYDGKYNAGWDDVRRERFKRQAEIGLFDESAPLGDISGKERPWRRLPEERREYLADKMEVHAAMVDRTDQGIGRILESLRDAGALDNTIVFFLSDNGSSPEVPGAPGYDRYSATRDGRAALRDAELQQPENHSKLGTDESYTGIGPGWASATNTPLRYWKMESYEGGCRTPMIVHWPAGLKRPAGSIVRDVGHVIDIAPTCLELAGLKPNRRFKMDGVSLAPVIANEPLDVDRTLYFMHVQGRGVRRGPYKASKLDRHGWELFNLDADPGETRDISGEKPDVLNSLVRELADWRGEVDAEREAGEVADLPVRTRPLAIDEDDVAVVRPPATPLVACDPYFSIWSAADKLTDADTTHWTGKPHRITSLLSIDGKPYRLLGGEPGRIPPLEQISTKVRPTQTTCTFAGAGIELVLTFTTPALPSDIDLLSLPITFLTYDVRSTDGREHDVQLYFEGSGELTVNTPDQAVTGSVEQPKNLVALKLGSKEQAVLARKGDDVRIDWGYFYVAASESEVASRGLAAPDKLRAEFLSGEPLAATGSTAAPRATELAAALTLDLPRLGATKVSRRLILAYDDLYSIEYLGKQLRPYWRRNGSDAADLLTQADRDYASIMERCAAFDKEFTADMVAAGGPEFAALGCLAYRQCFAAGKFVADANGQPLQFCKENHSNGCIATSDVFYPMSPQFLLFGSDVAKTFVVPFMDYAASDRWKFPFAPHDLGTYPKANGQVYGGGETSEENQMPVEECGNLLILMAAIAKLDGNANFAERYWPQLESWASYLKEKGFDPENQLCTDDFAGHMAHNVNLSAKAICGLGAYAQLCAMRGDAKQAAEYREIAEQFATRWVSEADDGNHFRLAFDKPGTWSQKYNLVWDRLLGLNLFPAAVADKEMAFYRNTQNRYGLPLDSRKGYTKLDWILWTATLTGKRDDFQSLVKPVVHFLDETPSRVPMTDWYGTRNGRRVAFTARPVVGGVFMQMLCDDAIWRKWAAEDSSVARN
jgi:arylsulfatase A-like enzyme